MITLFENFDPYDREHYLKDYKKYILIYSGRSDIYALLKNLGNQFKKIYHSTRYNNKLEPYNENFYFTINYKSFTKMYLYDSDNLQDVIDKFKILKNVNKYNL
jgi:hypothetical protein